MSNVECHFLSLVASPLLAGTCFVPPVAALGAPDEPTGQAHHPKDNPDDQPDEGAGDEGEVLQEPPRQRPGHGRRLQVGDELRSCPQGKILTGQVVVFSVAKGDMSKNTQILKHVLILKKHVIRPPHIKDMS